jgi:hypothetical protein
VNIGALPDLILAWFKNQGVDMLQAGKEPPAQGQFKPGQQYEGQVLDSLPNGRNLVQVANQKLDMMLPQQARPGDVVRLTFLQSGPRPTFMLNAEPAAPPSRTVSVSQAAQQVSALVRYEPTSAASATPSVTVATTAQAAASTAAAGATAQAATTNAAAASPAAGASTAASSSPAQMTATAANAATTMANTAAQAAAAGKPIIANPSLLLATTPVAAGTATGVAGPAIPAMMSSSEAVGGAYASMAANPNLSSAQGVATQQAAVAYVLPMRLQQTIKESGMFYESHLGKWARGEVSLDSILREPQAALAKSPGHLLDLPDLAGMPEKAANMASRQLSMLESGTLVWQGQPWPGQNMAWQITEREGGGNAGEEEMQKWHSQLNMILPRLGGVSAALDVGALGLRIRLTAETPETLAEMKAALPELAQRMQASELNLTSLQVRPAHGNA